MLSTYDYDQSYIPSMPVAEITISRDIGSAAIKLMAILDSGSDATIIPLRFLKQLRVRSSQPGWLRGTAIHATPINLYVVALQFANVNVGLTRVVGSAEYDEAILGRDVLNQFIVTLNGLASVVEISD